MVALSCCLLAAGTTANAARQRVAVLGIEPKDEGDARSQQRTAALARALTESLRSRASQTSFDLAPGSQKELLELKLLSDCLDEAPDCMAAIGRDLGAEVVIYGHLQRNKDASYGVSVRSIVVATKKPGDVTLDRALAAGEASEDGLRKLAPLAFPSEPATPMTPTAHDTQLIVDTNVPDGTIYVNGVQRGTVTPRKSTVIRGLPPGSVLLAISAPGYRKAEMNVEVKEGQPARATLTLEATAAVAAPPASLPPAAGTTPEPVASGKRPGGTARVLFWTSLVATGAGVAAFTVTGLKVRSIENEQDDAIRDFDFAANGSVMHPGDACAEAKADNYTKLVDICDRGKRMATVTNVLIGATAAAAVATAIFYWRGYLAPGPAMRERADNRRTPTDTGVVFGPELYKNGAGFGATIQF